MTDATVIFPDMPVPLEDGQQDSIYDCTEAENPVLFLSDTETYQLTFQVTAEQWVKLFSAATAGADLLYPDQSIDVVFPLRQAVDCMPTFCEAVQECIVNVPDIQITLIQITNYWGEEGEDGELPPVTETNPQIGEDCDLDNLFGACTQMVDLIDQTITDIFEIIEAVTNGVELANEMLELIPGLNFLASVLDIANVLQEQLAENYAAAYTTLVRDDLRCALFCAIKDDCTLDFASMVDVFSTLAGQSVLTLDIEDFVEFFTQGTFSGVEVVYASFWFVAGMMQYGGKVFNIDANRLVQISASFFNDPDGDWITLCDCGDSETWDFTLGELGWSAVAWSGCTCTNSTPDGWIGCDLSIAGSGLLIEYTLPAPVSIEAMAWEWYAPGARTNESRLIRLLLGAATKLDVQIGDSGDPAIQSNSATFAPVLTNKIQVYLADKTAPAVTDPCRFTELTIQY